MSKSNSFRVGKVSGYLRGRVWYLCYFENGKRRRPRAGGERDAARQLAAQVNSQLETGAPSALSFELIGIPDLRTRWLEHHEQVRRSSVQSIARYRTATDHLLRFLDEHQVRHASQFTATHAAEFVHYLRTIRVSPNGHANTPKRPLLDKGVRYVLECCRALFNHAARRRHLPPYVENPFATVEIDRIPVETARVIELLTPDQERAFLGAGDEGGRLRVEVRAVRESVQGEEPPRRGQLALGRGDDFHYRPVAPGFGGLRDDAVVGIVVGNVALVRPEAFPRPFRLGERERGKCLAGEEESLRSRCELRVDSLRNSDRWPIHRVMTNYEKLRRKPLLFRMFTGL
ncbi:MAG: hypothetical protein FJ304_26670, partial [Planctomycetes bacterium]|nr:hypothetical protein [Planctomycetota bacterium]